MPAILDMSMTKLRTWLLLIAVLYLAPATIALASAASEPAIPVAGDTFAHTSSAGHECAHCVESGDEPCADSECCFVCSAGLVVFGVHAAPVALRDAVAIREYGPLAQAEFPPPFRPPIG